MSDSWRSNPSWLDTLTSPNVVSGALPTGTQVGRQPNLAFGNGFNVQPDLLNKQNIITVNGNQFVSSSLVAGTNVTLSQSSGQTVISAAGGTQSGWVDGGGKMRTTGSVAIDSSGNFAPNIGTDVYFYVSGTTSTSQLRSDMQRVTALSDTVVTGSLVNAAPNSTFYAITSAKNGLLESNYVSTRGGVRYWGYNTANILFNIDGTTTHVGNAASTVTFQDSVNYGWLKLKSNYPSAGGYVQVSPGGLPTPGTDVIFVVSGSTGLASGPDRHVTVLGGDVVLSGSQITFSTSSTSPTITQAAVTSEVGPQSLTLAPQAPWPGASTYRTAGDVIVNVPTSVVGGNKSGGLSIQYGGANSVIMGPYANNTYGAIWFKSSAGGTNYSFLGDNSTQTVLNAPAAGALRLNFNGQVSSGINMTTSIVEITGPPTLQFGANVVSPRIGQAVTGSGSGQNLTIAAQAGSAGANTTGQIVLSGSAVVLPGATAAPTLGTDVVLYVSGTASTTGLRSSMTRVTALSDTVVTGSLVMAHPTAAFYAVTTVTPSLLEVNEVSTRGGVRYWGYNATNILMNTDSSMQFYATAGGYFNFADTVGTSFGRMQSRYPSKGGYVSLGVFDNLAAAQVTATDVGVFISGSTTSAAGTDKRVTVFGGDVVMSGSLVGAGGPAGNNLILSGGMGGLIAVGSGVSFGARTITGSYVVDSLGSDHYIFSNCPNVQNLTGTLPTATPGRRIIFRDIAANGGTMYITASNSNLINNSTHANISFTASTNVFVADEKKNWWTAA